MLRFTSVKITVSMFDRVFGKMLITFVKPAVLLLLLVSVSTLAAFGRSVSSVSYKEDTEAPQKQDIPIIVKHLPDWENIRNWTYARDIASLKTALGDRSALDLIDFTGGTEAVTAPYNDGKLLIIEYSTPQASIEADEQITSRRAGLNEPNSVYRRIGNYNVFVFDISDPAAANALLDQVKYEKTVQWLGKNPFDISPERAFVLTTSDIFLSTVLAILIGIGIALIGGAVTGYAFFTFRDRRRAGMTAFTDAGGMTRLNLDGLTAEIGAERLLGD
jgi:hypothetical protein